jgi:purine-nucleoside phosphorylase
MPEKELPLVTPRKLVQTFADRYGVDVAELTLPATAVLTPVYPLFMKLTRALGGGLVTSWTWKHPPFHEFPLGEGEKGVLACCPIGAPNVAIALEELAAFGVRTLYFFGFAGGIGRKVPPGTLILSRYAHVGEGTTRYYGNTPLTFADEGLLENLKRGLEAETGDSLATCPVWTTDALYREMGDEVERFTRMGVYGVDMEVSVVYSVAKALSVRAVALLWISDALTLKGWEPHFYHDALREGIEKYVEAFAAVIREGKAGVMSG